MSEVQSKVSPIVAIAAVAVIIFSVIGVGVMTGVIPSSKSTVTTIQVPEPKAGQAPGAKSGQTTARNASPATPAKKRPAQVAANEPAPAAAPVPAPVPGPRVCAECGVIDSINAVEQKGQGSGLGAAGGAVVGGLLGNQVGGGRGNTVATVAGAVGGALAGNEIEKRVKSTKQYNVSVRMDDGNFRSFTFDSAPGYAIGEKVKVIDGRLVKS